MFHKATKESARLRMALIGPAGSGKTYTGLSIAQHLGGSVAVLDTEHGSASKYADLFDFDVVELDDFDPRRYVEVIHEAGKAGYSALVIDSLSHAWMGKGGALELKDRTAAQSRSGNSFDAWRTVTPLHNQLVEAMITAPIHIIATLRTKTEYVVETDDRGKNRPRKVGLAPVQRDGLEYEFDVVADLDQDNNLIITKTRCPALTGQVFNKAGIDVAEALSGWLQGSINRVDTTLLINELRELRKEIHTLGGPLSNLTVNQMKAMAPGDLEAEIARTSRALEGLQFELETEEAARLSRETGT